ncbi:FAD-dependent oxidoreductase [Microbacterium murale]|uniref:2-polyprenyl-6-methoxyphenol hydroxylase-like FAD-dependent oxidoreductase n=1 Tax=Microbacterium murale TaxID=1081040 RepID=A0ABU0PAG2_9MICO|nr:NAD(P)/FAD-dependent oxidoreductase [Microbacterium murale]MDQ0644325.1 2-polyprenyl-6-methoxyphenol hydroxylase-like FAD-dependent oxidoreductase [Microbacterium murale]
MSTTRTEPEAVAVIGAGPAGIATALALHAVGIPVKLYERYAEPSPAGNIVNLWPPAVQALEHIGVDVEDIGAFCETEFRNSRDKVRARVKFPQSVVDKYGNGGFIGLTRPDLYERMVDALPPGIFVGNKQVAGLEDEGDHVVVRFQDDTSITTPLVVGADGINSVVRETVWGLPPIREHNLHVIGGFTFDLPAAVNPREAILRHSRTVQASHTGIRSKGRDGAEWWVLQAWDPQNPAPVDLKAHALFLAKEFPPEVAELIANTSEEHIFRWPIRDRGDVPKVWSKGRVTFAGDAVHATSPYAAYGAGMSIVDGYFLGQTLNGVDLGDSAALKKTLARYEELRVEHTAAQVKQAYMLGRNFHHVPTLMRPLRDAIFDHTKFLQKMVGDSNPAEISAQLDIMGSDLHTPAAVARAAR